MRLTHLVRPPYMLQAQTSASAIAEITRTVAPRASSIEATEEFFATATGTDPLHDPTLEPRDEAVFLLHAAAEVEHALMVQYLYAAYSLRENYTGADKPAELARWRAMLLQIAREEMAHLISVENLLHLIGGPLNFEREDFPFRSAIYPFRFQLEPLTKGSLAKYVYAEMPGELTPDPATGTLPSDIAEIKKRAERANGNQPLNHVGWLYERILMLFRELPEDAFRTDSVRYWARKVDWLGGPIELRHRLLIGPEIPDPVSAEALRTAALEALSGIARQGEGDGDPVESHYQLFRQLYEAFHFRETDEHEAFPAWMVPVQLNPNTISHLEVPHDAQLPEELRAGRIRDPRTRAWAQLLNQRYRLLLGYLEHTLSATLDLEWREADQVLALRRFLRGQAFAEMRRVSAIAGQLGALPEPSGAPFELPYTLSLPDRDRDRWLSHVDVLRAADRLITELREHWGDADNRLLETLLKADEETVSALLHLATGELPPAPSSPLDRMVQLIEQKVRDDHAAAFHAGIKLDGVTPLSDLFDPNRPGNSRFELLLKALVQSSSVRAQPGERLVIPAKPDESVLFRILSVPLIEFMARRFSDEDRQIVREWIDSLSEETGSLSFAAHIRPLFRPMDVQSMKDISGFDLSNYEDVKRLAPVILERLQDGSMPCDGAWPDRDIAQFRQWIDDGLHP